MRQSIHFSQTTLRPFFEGTYPRVSFQMLRFVMTHFLGLNSLSQSQLLSIRYMNTTHNCYDTLKDLTLCYLQSNSLFNIMVKKAMN